MPSLELDTYIPIVVALFCAPDGRVQSPTNFRTEDILIAWSRR
jgi:hypothetical protein